MPRGKPGSGERPGVNAYYKLSERKRREVGPYTPKLGRTLLKAYLEKVKKADKARVAKAQAVKPAPKPKRARVSKPVVPKPEVEVGTTNEA